MKLPRQIRYKLLSLSMQTWSVNSLLTLQLNICREKIETAIISMERACLSADKKERKSYAAKNKRRTGRKERILENTSERLTDELFGKNLAMYTFSEQCEEVSGLALEDGTKKIFLNMASTNGRKELVSLLQYMKNTTLDDPNNFVTDERIQSLHRIVEEVKQSEEWEAVKMGILEIGLERGMETGIEVGRKEAIVKTIEILKDMDLPDEEIKKKISMKYEMTQTDVESIMKQISVSE